MPGVSPGISMVGIQADDLTGACDTGAVFAARGLSTVVILGDAPAPPADVLVLDTESRAATAEVARARARAAGERLGAARPALLYKKCDSTLRGHVTAELAGVAEGAGRAVVVLAPAFPAQGRTVVDGALRIGGVPAARSPVARDPTFPLTGGSVPALLAGAWGRPVAVVPLATVRAGPAAVAARIARLAGAFVCDAETHADLGVLAAATDGIGALLAGSAGLAAALAERLTGPPSGATAVRLRPPLLVVAGSPHPATQAQVRRLGSAGAAGSVLAAPATAAGPDVGRSRAVADELARAARRVLEGAEQPGTLVLTGGETAASVCRELGATGFRLRGELEPGIAVAALLDGPFAGLTVVTKAGGFGDPEVLVRIHASVRA